jgi:acyl-CoA thioester hydrolase
MTPESFELELVVEEQDIDMLGHTSNIVFVRWIQDVAHAHSAAVGLDMTAYRRINGVFVIVRHEIDYLRPAMLGDRVRARTWVSDVTAATCIRHTELTRVSDGELLARGRTTWAFVAMDTGRPRRITPDVRAAFERYVA